MEPRTPVSHSVRTLGGLLAAATVALPLGLGLLAPARADVLVPFALVLPFVTMGALEAAMHRRDRLSNR
jgi:hypothetical protein